MVDDTSHGEKRVMLWFRIICIGLVLIGLFLWALAYGIQFYWTIPMGVPLEAFLIIAGLLFMVLGVSVFLQED